MGGVVGIVGKCDAHPGPPVGVSNASPVDRPWRENRPGRRSVRALPPSRLRPRPGARGGADEAPRALSVKESFVLKSDSAKRLNSAAGLVEGRPRGGVRRARWPNDGVAYPGGDGGLTTARLPASGATRGVNRVALPCKAITPTLPSRPGRSLSHARTGEFPDDVRSGAASGSTPTNPRLLPSRSPVEPCVGSRRVPPLAPHGTRSHDGRRIAGARRPPLPSHGYRAREALRSAGRDVPPMTSEGGMPGPLEGAIPVTRPARRLPDGISPPGRRASEGTRRTLLLPPPTPRRPMPPTRPRSG